MSFLFRSSSDKVKNIDANLRKCPPFLTIIILSWNRLELLRTTVLSLLANTHCPFEMFIVDNNSSKNCTDWIKFISKDHSSIQPILLNENRGGEAINCGLERATGRFICISENDLEYLPDWDINMLIPFFCFKRLGQISPFSPFPMLDMGEVWNEKAFKVVRTEGCELKIAVQNVGSTSLVRREVIDAGVRFENLVSRDGLVRFPADAKFSADIKLLGYWVAWSNDYQVLNWGHIANSWQESSGYYRENWEAKAQSKIDGLGDYEVVLRSLEGKSHEEKESILKTKIGELLQRIESQSNNIFPKSDFSVCSTMFVMTEDDFTADQVSLAMVNPYASRFDIKFDLSDFKKIDGLRWDPYEGSECRVNLTSIIITDQIGIESVVPLESVQHNGKSIANSGRITFCTTDPMYMFPASGEFTQCRLQGTWELIEPEKSYEVFDCRIGNVLQGKYKLTLKYDRDLNSIEFFDGNPTLLKHLGCVNIRILEKKDHFLSLALNIIEDCDDFWIQYGSSCGYQDNYELHFSQFSKCELVRMEWTWKAFFRHVIKETLRPLGVRKVSETSRILSSYAMKSQELNQLLTQGRADPHTELE